MIKFFRRIREQLMAENKIGKYLLYALGEIVLVVIGILIALSINNWNEERKLQNMGKEYIGDIYTDLRNEISNIEGILYGLRTQAKGTENVLSHFEDKDKVIEDTVQFTEDHWAPARMFIIQRDINTFDKLRSTGQPGLLKNDSLTNLLDRFYKNFDDRISNFKEYPLQVRMELRKVSFPIGDTDDFQYEIENNKLSPAFIGEYLNNEEVYKHLLAILKTCRYNINFFEESSTEAHALIDYLEENYPELKKEDNRHSERL